jgi:hypothetical protein
VALLQEAELSWTAYRGGTRDGEIGIISWNGICNSQGTTHFAGGVTQGREFISCPFSICGAPQ